MTACEHEWRWLPRPLYFLKELGGVSTAYNARCERCGQYDWKHGTMPDARPAIRPAIPTTGRS